MNRLVLVTFLLPVYAVFGCQRAPQSAPAEEAAQAQLADISRKVDELKTLLADSKRGPGAEQGVRNWFDANLIPGKTTLDDTQRLLGSDYFDLDRPLRDDVLTIQYSLDEVAGKKLVLDFSRQSPQESSWLPVEFVLPFHHPWRDPRWVLEKKQEMAGGICGFCPHILVDDGGWRLEGKMLAGAVGAKRKRSDSLILTRANGSRGTVRVKLANWAPENEYLESIELGFASVRGGDQVDFDSNGHAYAWRPNRALAIAQPTSREGNDFWELKLDAKQHADVLVLELRNTEKFQNLAKESYLRDEEPVADISLGGAKSDVIRPVGTKFLRRVVVPLAANSPRLRLSSPAGLWWLRRAWLGSGASVSLTWVAAIKDNSSAGAVVPCDGRQLSLKPNESAELSFRTPEARANASELRLALRVHGYYEFLGAP